MGFAVIQGYGLTETAPIVTLNHPFKTSKGSVGHANRRRRDPHRRGRRDSGARRERDERLLRVGSATPQAQSPDPSAAFDADGWLHTGDIGERDAQGRLFIKGRKKEMIVTPEGLNVFPEDVERVLDALPGVRESAVVGVAARRAGTRACGARARARHDPEAVVRDGQRAARRITSASARASIWTDGDAARTEGTRKLKRAAIREWVRSGSGRVAAPRRDTARGVDARFARGRDVEARRRSRNSA